MLQTCKNLTLFIQWIFVTVIRRTSHIVIFFYAERNPSQYNDMEISA